MPGCTRPRGSRHRGRCPGSRLRAPARPGTDPIPPDDCGDPATPSARPAATMDTPAQSRAPDSRAGARRRRIGRQQRPKPLRHVQPPEQPGGHRGFRLSCSSMTKVLEASCSLRRGRTVAHASHARRFCRLIVRVGVVNHHGRRSPGARPCRRAVSRSITTHRFPDVRIRTVFDVWKIRLRRPRGAEVAIKLLTSFFNQYC